MSTKIDFKLNYNITGDLLLHQGKTIIYRLTIVVCVNVLTYFLSMLSI